MEEIEVRWIHAIQVMWSWLWRTVAIVFLVSLLIAAIGGFTMAVLKIDGQEEYAIYPQMIGWCLWTFISVSVLKKILSKSFNGYRIALIKVDTSAFPGHPQF